ncbi:hypothetical protein GCM10008119_00010 [Pedobacter mendelii]|uniref:Uncharacterized protein n=1 Tax=Pedobacter mendelii TaxID=1908240 RepID=A0ABQ2BE41_9SPHI|nr:hypothetical protein GCM10008119_00010 [Pedobacter mendelii]
MLIKYWDKSQSRLKSTPNHPFAGARVPRVNSKQIARKTIGIVMSRKYKFYNKEGLYFVSFATVYWIDACLR